MCSNAINFLKKLFLFVAVFAWTASFSTQAVTAEDIESKDAKVEVHYSAWNVIDRLVQEKGYLHIQDISHSLQNSITALPKEKAEVVNRLNSSVSLLHWLEDPSGQLAPIYREQIENRLNQFVYIEAWTVYNHNKTPLLSKGGRLPLETLNEKIKIDKGGFSTPLYEGNRLMGYLQARWNVFLFPELFINDSDEDTVQTLLLTYDKDVIGGNSHSPKIKNYILANQYKGPLAGRQDGLRFYSFSVGSNTILFVYPAVSLLYYFFRIFLYLFVFVLLFLLFIFIQHYRNNQEEKEYNESSWADNKLQEAISLNQETMELTKEGHSMLFKQKQKDENNMQEIISSKMDDHRESLKNEFKKSQESLLQKFNKLFERENKSNNVSIEEKQSKKSNDVSKSSLDKKEEVKDEKVNEEKNSPTVEKEKPKEFSLHFKNEKNNSIVEQIKEKAKEVHSVLNETQKFQEAKQARLTDKEFVFQINEKATNEDVLQKFNIAMPPQKSETEIPVKAEEISLESQKSQPAENIPVKEQEFVLQIKENFTSENIADKLNLAIPKTVEKETTAVAKKEENFSEYFGYRDILDKHSTNSQNSREEEEPVSAILLSEV